MLYLAARNMRKDKDSGFTIVELIVTTSIAAALAGVAAASFFNNYERERMRSGSRILASWLEDQRRKAIQNSSPCDIVMNYADQTTSSLCDFTGAATETLDLRTELGDNRLTIENHSLGTSDPYNTNAEWSFTPRGTTTAEIELRLGLDNASDTTERCIYIMSPLGIIRQGRFKTEESACDYTTVY